MSELNTTFCRLNTVRPKGEFRVITDCPHCESKVDCVERGSVELSLEYSGWPTQIVLLQCKVCKNALLGISEIIQVGEDEWEWDSAARLWLSPEGEVDSGIPEIERNSLVEAKICFKAKAYSACAVASKGLTRGLSGPLFRRGAPPNRPFSPGVRRPKRYTH
jgi:hypothetical protein